MSVVLQAGGVALSPPPVLTRPISAPDSATLAALVSSPPSSPLISTPSPSPPSPSLTPAESAAKKAAERATKRSKLIQEIHETERHYASSMGRLVSEYLQPLRLHSSDYGVKADTLTAVFSNIEQLSSFHAVLCSEMLKAASPAAICLVFLKFVDFLRMYIPYVNGYSEGVKALTALQDNKRWQRFCSEKKAQMGLDLTSFLIMPVQRIPRYELLLKELRRNIEQQEGGPASDESLLLDETLAKIVAVAQKVNEAKREAERTTTLQALVTRIAHLDSAFPASIGGINLEHRRLVKEGSLYKKSTFGKKARVCLLFNDCFVWCSGSHRYKGHIGLVQLRVQAAEEEGAGGQGVGAGGAEGGKGEDWTLELSHPDMKTLLLSAESSYDHQQWLSAFTEAVEEARKLDPQLADKFARVRHERGLSVSVSKQNTNVSVDGSPSPVSAPPSPRPATLEEEEEEEGEDAVRWQRNALKGDDAAEEEKQPMPPPPPVPARPSVVAEQKAQVVVQAAPHARQQSRVLDIRPAVKPERETQQATETAVSHARNVSVTATIAAAARAAAEEKEQEKSRAAVKKPVAAAPTVVTPMASKLPTLLPSSLPSATPRNASSSVSVSSSSPSLPSSPSSPPLPPLSSLSRNDMTALKKMKSPPLPVKLAIESLAVVLDLPLGNGSLPPASSSASALSALYWTAIQSALVKPTFMSSLLALDSARLTSEQCRRLRPYITNPALTIEGVRDCSSAAAVLWSWVRGRWAESSGEQLPAGDSRDAKARTSVTAKVDSGNSRRGTPGHSRQNSATRLGSASVAHSRQGSISGSSFASAGHAGISVSTSRVVLSPTPRTTVATPRQPVTKDSKHPAKTGKDTAASSHSSTSSSAVAVSKAKRSAGSASFNSLELGTLQLVLSFLSFHDVFHPRSSVAAVNRRCLHSALHLLLSLNVSVTSSLSQRTVSLKASLTSSLTAAALRSHLSSLSSTRSHLTAALSAVSPSTLKGIRALVKPPASIVPVFEGVLLTMELREGAKERRRKEKEQRDMTLVAHKAVVAQPQLTAFLSSLTPRMLLPLMDATYTARLQQLTAGMDAAAIEKSSPLAGPLARWLAAVADWAEWCRRTGGAAAASGVVASLVELEDDEWKLRCAGVMGMTDADADKTDNLKQYAAAMAVARALRGR